MIAVSNPNETESKENTRNIWNSYIGWGVRNPMEHKAIHADGAGVRGSPTKPGNASKRWFRELNELCQRSIKPVFQSEEYPHLMAMRCFFRWPETTH